jgi:N-acetylmuramoyl-L-alanine amidase
VKFIAVIVIALAFPAAALAEDVRLVTQEVPLGGGRALAAARPPVFDLVGLHWQGPGDVLFRTRSTRGRWTAWREAMPEPLDLPDANSAEGRSALRWKLGNPFWVGQSNAIQYRFRGRVTRLRAHFVQSPVQSVPPRTLSIAGSPRVTPRAAWGANESIRRGTTLFAQSIKFAVIHHTAGANSYTAAQSAAIVRGIQTYHVKSNGWNDLGYNFVVDKYGQVFEGRYGGVDRNVVGAHAEGFNTGSVGIALLGTYGDAQPSSKALDAIASLLAWRLDVAHVDPLGRLSWLSGGNARFPSGTPVPLAVVAGHRDTGFTSCPGNALYRQLPTLARKAAEIGLPKLYEPVATGRVGGPIRFTARLSTVRPWSVRVNDATGTTIATGRGDGQHVDWTWDATLAAPGAYTYAIEAGPDMRPATGTIGQATTALTLTGAQARPATFTPNGDSQADSTVVSYTLSLPATVTATLRDPFGTALATLFSEQKKAGRQSFRFTAAGVVDGRYTIVLEASATNGRLARLEIPVVVDRTLAAFVATPPAFSPNGDQRADQLAFKFVLAAPAHVKLRIAGGETVYEGDLQPGPQELRWEDRIRDGKYAAILEATGPFGTRSQTARFVVDTTKPTLRLLSKAARRFWVSEQVTITGTVGGVRVQAKVGPGKFRLGGAPGRIAITAWDAAGNRSTYRRR